MRSGFLPARVVHVHPTRACNLACLHCYSDSSPRIRSSLDVESLLAALRLLRAEGYEVLSVSGGEPLVYRGLARLIQGAFALGYRVHIVTNGILLTRQRLAALKDYVALIAVSLDGNEAVHNLVRSRADAFAKANAGIDVLGESSVPFGIAFGVSRQSLEDVPWAYDRACEAGASLLQLRPLVAQGRGAALDDGWMLSPDDCARLSLIGGLLDSGPTSTPRVQVDLTHTFDLLAGRAQLDPLEGAPALLLSDVINPVVIDDRGIAHPFTFGIHERFAIGSLVAQGKRRIHEYKATRLGTVRSLVDRTLRRIEQSGVDFVDWYAWLTSESQRTDAPPFSAVGEIAAGATAKTIGLTGAAP